MAKFTARQTIDRIKQHIDERLKTLDKFEKEFGIKTDAGQAVMKAKKAELEILQILVKEMDMVI